jgi:hypothetical protein
MAWTKRKPTAPVVGEKADYYWYYDPRDKEEGVIEVWSDRDINRFDGWWWHPKVERALEDPPEVEKKKCRRKKND